MVFPLAGFDRHATLETFVSQSLASMIDKNCPLYRKIG